MQSVGVVFFGESADEIPDDAKEVRLRPVMKLLMR